MRKIFFYLGLVLELFGLASMMAVVVLFFGKTRMELLLYMSILAAVEFYGGHWMMEFFGDKK